METNDTTIEIKEMQLPDYAVLSLYKAARWAKVLAIFSFVMIGVLVLSYVWLYFIIGGAGIGYMGIAEIVVMVITLLIGGGVCGWLGYLLLRFSQTALAAIQQRNEQQLIQSFDALHKYFLIQGIVFIVCIALMAVSFFVAIVGFLM